MCVRERVFGKGTLGVFSASSVGGYLGVQGAQREMKVCMKDPFLW